MDDGLGQSDGRPTAFDSWRKIFLIWMGLEVYVSSFHHRFVPGNFVFKELMFAASRSLEIMFSICDHEIGSFWYPVHQIFQDCDGGRLEYCLMYCTWRQMLIVKECHTTQGQFPSDTVLGVGCFQWVYFQVFSRVFFSLLSRENFLSSESGCGFSFLPWKPTNRYRIPNSKTTSTTESKSQHPPGDSSRDRTWFPDRWRPLSPLKGHKSPSQKGHKLSELPRRIPNPFPPLQPPGPDLWYFSKDTRGRHDTFPVDNLTSLLYFSWFSWSSEKKQPLLFFAGDVVCY